MILAAAGLGEKDLSAEYLRPGVAAANITEGTLDGFFLIGGTPVPAIRALAAATPVRLIPIDDEVLAKMKEISSSYRRSVIPPEPIRASTWRRRRSGSTRCGSFRPTPPRS